MARLTIVGVGKMGRAILDAVVAVGITGLDEIVILDANPALLEDAALAHPTITVGHKIEASDIYIIATKPPIVREVAGEIGLIGKGLVISIAAGLSISYLEESLGTQMSIVRCMPNTPGQIAMGITALCANSNTTADELTWASSLLLALGEVVVVPESQIDAVTAISGSGPAYLFLIAEAMIDAGVALGLSADLSARLAVSTLLGSSELLARSNYDTRGLRLAVSSPGGTTIAATNEMEDSGLRRAIHRGIAAAHKRAKEIQG